ncbi:MAG: iron ABC transporter permease [Actinobacteria bacterium]|nr:iron ABC transporter permease [Actinomycetota bacterium]
MEHDRVALSTPRPATKQLNSLPRWIVPAVAALPAAMVAVFYLWPVATLLARVVRPRSITTALRIPGLANVIWFTFWQALVSTALTMAIGLLPAYLLSRYRFRGRRLLLAVVTIPFMLPTVVVGAAFLALLPSAWHGTVGAIVIAHIYFNIAVVVRLVGTMWEALPINLTAAARTLGASPLQLLRHVVLPLLRPALWAAATIVFLFSFTSFGAVRLLGGSAHPTLEVEIARRATQLGDVDGAAVLSMLQLFTLAIVIGLSARRQRTVARVLAGDTQPRLARTPRARLAVAAGAAVIGVVMIAPMALMVSRSFRLGNRWTATAWRELGTAEIRPGISLGVDPYGSLATSLRFAVVAMVISVVGGGLAAMAIAAARRHGGLLDVGLMMPLGTSAVTIGLGMLITFDTAPFDWRASWLMIPLGHALVAIPFVVRALLPVLRAIPSDQRAAAATLGASPTRAWLAVDGRRVVRPLAAAGGLAAAISLGEFGATTILTRAGRETLPIAIARLLGRAGELPRAQAFALSTILFVVTAAAIVTVLGAAEKEGVLRARSN